MLWNLLSYGLQHAILTSKYQKAVTIRTRTLSINVIHKRVTHTSEPHIPNRTKIREFYNGRFHQPYISNTCDFMLRLLDVHRFCSFVLGFTSALVAEISDFTTEIQRKCTDLCTSQMATHSCLTGPFKCATVLRCQNFGF